MTRVGSNFAVLVAIGAVCFFGTTQREKPVLSGAETLRVGALEAQAAAHPTDASALRALAQGYLDIRQPGMAIGVLDRAPPRLRAEPAVEHLYARALLDQGRSADALGAERRVLAACADDPRPACSSWLVASATRRADILEQLVQLGVEDARAQPEASRVAYLSATRQVSLSVAAY